MSEAERFATGCMRITSKVSSSNEIASRFVSKPQKMANVGEPKSPRNSKAMRDTSVCIYESALPRTVGLEDHLRWLVDFAGRHEGQLSELSATCEIDFVLAFGSSSGQGGFAMCHEQLRRMAQLRINMYVDLFPPEGREEE